MVVLVKPRKLIVFDPSLKLKIVLVFLQMGYLCFIWILAKTKTTNCSFIVIYAIGLTLI